MRYDSPESPKIWEPGLSIWSLPTGAGFRQVQELQLLERGFRGRFGMLHSAVDAAPGLGFARLQGGRHRATGPLPGRAGAVKAEARGISASHAPIHRPRAIDGLLDFGRARHENLTTTSMAEAPRPVSAAGRFALGAVVT